MHRVRTMFALSRVLRDENIIIPARCIEYLNLLPHERHLAGHHAKTMSSERIVVFATRLCLTDSIKSIDSSLVDWAWEVRCNGGWRAAIEPTRISPTAYRSIYDWRRIPRPRSLRKPVEGITECYPYAGPGFVGHDLLTAAHDAVSKGLPQDIRADVCQDLIVSVLAGEVSINNIRDAVPIHLRAHRKMYLDRWKLISLETPIGDGSRRLVDII